MSALRSARLTASLLLIALVSLAGCAVYRPAALPVAPDLTPVLVLTVPSSEFWLPGLEPHRFPANGLDETAVVTLAVFENPDLKAARLQTGVARAQLLQAGLLPDPQLSAGFATSDLNYGGDIGLSEDLRALITRSAATAGARAHQRQVYLNILWQEWQVAERARELFIELRSDDQLRDVLASTRGFFADRYHQDERAMQKGDVTLPTVTADLTLLTKAETKLRQLQLNASLARHQLDQLLGLQPDAQLRLTGSAVSQPLSKQAFQAAVAALPHRRADLLALQAGYAAQEQSVREAVLAQFPDLTAGVVLSRDPVEGVNSFGPTVSLSLPLFNRNRGQIAVQQATRAVLRQTYQARLDQAAGQADQVWKAANILQEQVCDLDARLSVLKSTAAAARKDFQEGNLAAASYVNVESSLLSAQAQAIQLRASLATAQSALQALLGLPYGTPAAKPQ